MLVPGSAHPELPGWVNHGGEDFPPPSLEKSLRAELKPSRVSPDSDLNGKRRNLRESNSPCEQKRTG
ncbi:hypothetical protein DV515_00016269 [Chloebia gouldiae]|uniref:Uncharacterized protein n=1 Tax=Chloebia gouldiae TaxID=44316 RepID=A0A3L8RUA7_CHLGU|nr:hypothetical protein DV515_00016269 [Chloebia gouldiae]